jgi:hypothetical protein
MPKEIFISVIEKNLLNIGPRKRYTLTGSTKFFLENILDRKEEVF